MCRSQLHSLYPLIFFLSFFHETAPSMIYTLSLHDALPIWELVILESIQARVSSEGRPHLVTVYGDAGVGKSRLVSEFLRRVDRQERIPVTLRGRCLPYGEGITYWPLAEILKSCAGVLDTDPPELALEKIRKLGEELFTEEITTAPTQATAALAYTVGVEDPAVSCQQLSPR